MTNNSRIVFSISSEFVDCPPEHGAEWRLGAAILWKIMDRAIQDQAYSPVHPVLIKSNQIQNKEN